MRDALAFVALLPVLAVLDVAFWLADPERRLVRTAIVAGIKVGRVAAEVVY